MFTAVPLPAVPQVMAWLWAAMAGTVTLCEWAACSPHVAAWECAAIAGTVTLCECAATAVPVNVMEGVTSALVTVCEWAETAVPLNVMEGVAAAVVSVWVCAPFLVVFQRLLSLSPLSSP